MSQQKVLCEQCDNIITLPTLKRNTLKGLIYEYYFDCPECDHRYISYYTNQKIRRDINRQKKRWKRYQRPGTEESERKLLAEINMQDKLIKKDMDRLYERMQGGWNDGTHR